MAVRKCDLGVGRGQSPTTVSLHSWHVRGERQGVGDDLEVVSAGGRKGSSPGVKGRSVSRGWSSIYTPQRVKYPPHTALKPNQAKLGEGEQNLQCKFPFVAHIPDFHDVTRALKPQNPLK